MPPLTSEGADLQAGSDRQIRPPARTSRWSFLVWLPLPLLAIVAAVVAWWGPDDVVESAVLLATLNTLFCGATSLALTFLAANTYRTTGQRGMLALACAALSLGVIFLVTGPLLGVSLDAALTLHNGGMLGAAALFVLSAIWTSRDRERQPSRTGRMPYVWASFLAVVAALTVPTLAALAGATHVFHNAGEGVTPLRQAVLGAAVLGFAVAAFLTGSTYRRGGSDFLKWSAAGLAMMAAGLAAVWLGEPGSAISWAGRAAQWTAGVYLLVASVTTVVDSGHWRIVLGRALRESEDRYLNLITLSPDAVVVQADGGCVFANLAAARLVEAASADALAGADVVDFFAPEHRDLVTRRIREARDGALLTAEESVVMRRDGCPVPVEVTGARVEHRGSPAVQLVIRDITARRAAETAQREREAELVAHEERTRIARDLHDSVTQALFAATLKAEALAVLCEGSMPEVTASAEEVLRLDRGALAQMRALLLELRGDPVGDVPIRQLLRNAVESAESRAAVRVTLGMSVDSSLPADVHEAVYRITLEALNNVVRHAGAANASVQLDVDRSRALLVVGDDGRGFDTGAVLPGHYGLVSMRERAVASGGRLALVSAPDEGTLVTAEWGPPARG